MITGMGCCAMILRRNVSPSMRGISISSVITSGTRSPMRSAAATYGSHAVAITSIIGSVDRTWLSVCRTSAESSTMRTRTFRFWHHRPSRLLMGGTTLSGTWSRRTSTSPVPVWKRTARPRIPPMSDASTLNPSSSKTSSAASQFNAPTVGLLPLVFGTSQDVRAAEHFYLYLLTASSKRVKPLCQVANARVHIAVGLRDAGPRRAPRQDPVAQSAGSQSCTSKM